jgi:dipeptidyl aminopeptidase/acylaminoacyl peptidase
LRIGNLEAVSDWVMAHPSIDAERCGLLGSSFGGSTSLVKAAHDTRIRCVSLWATPHSLGNKEDPSAEGIAFKDSLYTDFAAYDLLEQARKVSRALVIHGKADEVVPSSEGEAIFRMLKDPKKLELIEGGDHTFSVASHRERAIKLSLEWFRRFLV